MIRVLEEILPRCEISEFNRKYIQKTACDDVSIRTCYDILKKIGLKDEKIATHANLLSKAPERIERNYKKLSEIGLSDKKIINQAQLLGRAPETIKRNYKKLSEIGVSDKKIATIPHLLGWAPETIRRNYQRLSAIGLNDKKIATLAHLLSWAPETIKRNYQELSSIGLSDKMIASQASLLGRAPGTIKRNYANGVGLLRNDYDDRNSGRDILLNQAQLLAISPITLENNIQWLADNNIEYSNGMVLGTKAQTKRKKMAWILREVFDYRKENDRPRTIQRMYNLIRDKPYLLKDSINALRQKKDSLRNQAAKYI